MYLEAAPFPFVLDTFSNLPNHYLKSATVLLENTEMFGMARGSVFWGGGVVGALGKCPSKFTISPRILHASNNKHTVVSKNK